MLGETVDGHRYFTKIAETSNRQLEMFKRAQAARQNVNFAPREIQIQKYMNGAPQVGSIFDYYSTSHSYKSGPLGKMVSQLEHQNPEARAGL
jgi:hypothetical protein